MTQLPRLKMLNAALAILDKEITAMREWAALELMGVSETTEKALDAISVGDFFDDMDSAIQVFAEARNKYAEARELAVPNLTLYFTTATYDDIDAMNKER